MNFQTIPPVETSKDILDVTFRKARERSTVKKIKGPRDQIKSKKELIKVDVVKEVLVTRLQKILDTFPKENELPSFYQKLLKLTLDYPQYKQSLGAVYWAIKRVSSMQKEYARKIVKGQGDSKQYYGRISSFIKQIEPNLRYLEKSRQIMRTYPDIKEMFTVCIYGFPNVGKSTLLNKLTGSKAKVAGYAFTTLTINSGFWHEIQFLDVPGTLAREEKMNNIELQAELVRKEVADLIIYVFDVTEKCGFSLKDQKQLYRKLGKPSLVYLSKQDLMSVEEFEYKHYSVDELKGEVVKKSSKV